MENENVGKIYTNEEMLKLYKEILVKYPQQYDEQGRPQDDNDWDRWDIVDLNVIAPMERFLESLFTITEHEVGAFPNSIGMYVPHKEAKVGDDGKRALWDACIVENTDANLVVVEGTIDLYSPMSPPPDAYRQVTIDPMNPIEGFFATMSASTKVSKLFMAIVLGETGAGKETNTATEAYGIFIPFACSDKEAVREWADKLAEETGYGVHRVHIVSFRTNDKDNTYTHIKVST